MTYHVHHEVYIYILTGFRLPDKFLYVNEKSFLALKPAIASVYIWRAKSALKNLDEYTDSPTIVQHQFLSFKKKKKDLF